MTFPRIMRLLLILTLSLSLWPVAPVEFYLSEPAKSIKLISEVFSVIFLFVSWSNWIYLKCIVVTVCALEDVAFMLVAPIDRFLFPFSICASISA